MTVVLYVLKWKVFDFRLNWRAFRDPKVPTYAEALDDLDDIRKEWERHNTRRHHEGETTEDSVSVG